jgi:predicted hotdog family 3-hydroxylacyl-ACP dehydratase
MYKYNPLFEGHFVEKLLPQKAPFVMVDKIYAYTEQSIISGLTVKQDNILFNKGCFTEAGLIEHMAQTIALHTGYSYYLKQESAPVGYIGSIKDIEIKALPKLGDELQTTATILHEFAGVTLVDISAKINNTEIARGKMKTVLANK